MITKNHGKQFKMELQLSLYHSIASYSQLTYWDSRILD